MRRLAPLLTALFAVAAHPPFGLGPLALAALVPLLAATGRGAREDFRAGWLAGTLASAGIAWWVYYAMNHFGGIPWWLGAPLTLLMAAAMGLYWGAFAWARGALRRAFPRIPDLLVVPLLWTAVEYARAVTPDVAFPWAPLGHAFADLLPLVQVADLAGVWGVSFLAALVNAALLGVLIPGPGGRGRGPARVRAAAVAAAVLAAWWGYGASRLAAPEPGRRARVAVVQGNIRQDVKWDPAFREETYLVHEALTRAAAAAGADLVVWPESATAFYYQQEPEYRRRMAELVRETGTPLLFGSPARIGERGSRSLRNRAYLLDAEGRVAGWQDKRHLVPFGEYVPWKRALFFAKPLVQAVGEFTPGERAAVLPSPAGGLGTLVCYEAIFPALARDFVAAGAGIIVNLTNDAWYERSAASKQQFASLVFRAVENRRPVARAANTGISGFVDAQGRVLLATPLFVRGQYRAELAVPETRTLYTRWGDWFPKACAALAGLLLALAAVRTGQASRRGFPSLA